MQRSALCRSRRELSNEYLLAKFSFDTAANEPCKICPLSAYRSPRWIHFLREERAREKAEEFARKVEEVNQGFKDIFHRYVTRIQDLAFIGWVEVYVFLTSG